MGAKLLCRRCERLPEQHINSSAQADDGGDLESIWGPHVREAKLRDFDHGSTGGWVSWLPNAAVVSQLILC